MADRVFLRGVVVVLSVLWFFVGRTSAQDELPMRASFDSGERQSAPRYDGDARLPGR